MVSTQHHDIENLDKLATEHELIAHRTRNHSTWLKNELRAAELRRRIEVLRPRIAKPMHDYAEK